MFTSEYSRDFIKYSIKGAANSRAVSLKFRIYITAGIYSMYLDMFI